MMKDGSDKGFPTKAGSSFSRRIVAWRLWALITRARQECRAGSLIWSVFISRCFLEMEAACPHSLSSKSITFFAQPWEENFCAAKKHFSHAWISSHTYLHAHPFMCSAEFACSDPEIWMQTGFKSSNSLSFFLKRHISFKSLQLIQQFLISQYSSC